jgi:hypothetical protein
LRRVGEKLLTAKVAEVSLRAQRKTLDRKAVGAKVSKEARITIVRGKKSLPGRWCCIGAWGPNSLGCARDFGSRLGRRLSASTSTAFGWRLTALRMTGFYRVEEPMRDE